MLVQLSNPRNPNLTPIKVNALADTGALMLRIPQHIAVQLELDTESVREVSVADGRRMSVPYVGPLRIDFVANGFAMSARWCWATRYC